MASTTGEFNGEVLRLDFDRRLLLAYRELDDALGLTAMAGEIVADARTGRNCRHALVGAAFCLKNSDDGQRLYRFDGKRTYTSIP